jgi:magnesium-protoporphyrin IX monomethyl ester (oxidative) cyclase
MASTSGADYLVLGEGEIPFLQLLEGLARSAVLSGIPGVVNCHSDDATQTAPHHTACLDALPEPARDLLPYREYTKHSQRNILDTPTASIFTSRGCPYDCEFCSIHPVFGYKWRARSPEFVLNEVDHLIGRYGVRNLEIEDDNFTLDQNRASIVLEGLIRRNERVRRLTWTAPNGLRMDTLDETMVALIARSQCRHAFLALEHGDDDVLNNIIGKALDLDHVCTVARLFHKYAVPCYVFVLYGYPGETEQAFGRALRYYRHLKTICPAMEFAFLLPEPYPRTRLWEKAVDSDWIPRSAFDSPAAMSRFYSSDGPWITTPDMPREEILRRGAVLRQAFPSEQTYVEGVDALPPKTDYICQDARETQGDKP